MGFLSKYTKTERLDLGDGFWVDIRPHLTAAQKAAAEDKLISNDGKSAGMAVGTGSYTLEVAVQAIVDWNLTDEADRPLPVRPEEARRSSIALLPAFVTDKVLAAVKGADGRTKQQEADFPASGDTSAPGTGEVPATA